jgi:hypothetical protein
MNIQETLALISALKNAGVTHFRSNDLEISLGASASPIPSGTPPTQVVGPVVPPVPSEVITNEEATEKIKDLISTLNMTPEQLANQMFKEDGAE